VGKHIFLHLVVVHTLCLEMYQKNNLSERDGIANDTSENVTGTGAMPVGWKQEKKHGNGTTKAFPCKILIQTKHMKFRPIKRTTVTVHELKAHKYCVCNHMAKRNLALSPLSGCELSVQDMQHFLVSIL